jgi:hypothetical protein
MEGRIEDGHMWNIRKRALRCLDRLESRLVVKRRERRQLADRALHLLVEDDRLTEAGTTVNDAMTDRLAVDFERVDRRRLAPLDEVQLQARRARVDD